MAVNFEGVDPSSFLVGGVVAGLVILAVIIFVAIYVYFALAWMKIAEKKKYKRPWLAWIPFANIAMWLQLGGFHWTWVFLGLIPFLGWIALGVLFIISHWRVYESLKYPGWLSLALVLNFIPSLNGAGTLAYIIIIGLVAWKKK